MSEVKTPTHEELEELEEVAHEVTGKWRWGTEEFYVFHRESDETYWRASFRVSGEASGDEHGFRNKEYSLERVYRIKKTIDDWDTNPHGEAL